MHGYPSFTKTVDEFEVDFEVEFFVSGVFNWEIQTLNLLKVSWRLSLGSALKFENAFMADVIYLSLAASVPAKS